MSPALDVFDATRELHLAPGAALVAVLGYSDRRGTDLHPICAARLAAAALAAEGAGAVVLLRLVATARRRAAPRPS